MSMTEPSLEPSPMKHRASARGFPRGWYCVAEAEDAAVGRLKPVSCLDKQLVVYRTPEGEAQVANAFCPHLGAHLASHDGHIDNGAIVCPFHKWRWDSTTGKCVDIPYSRVVPPNVRLELYPTREIDGVILMWYHPTGGAPDFEPYRSDALAKGKWRLFDVRSWTTSCPFQDILENLFDTAHIVYLHNGHEMPVIRGFAGEPYGLKVDYSMNPQPGETPLSGMICHLTGVTGLHQVFDLGEITTVFFHTFTPIDGERFIQKTRLYITDTGSEELVERIGRPWIERFCLEVEQDLRVLNYKRHLDRPALCSGDGPIMRFREYASQYY